MTKSTFLYLAAFALTPIISKADELPKKSIATPRPTTANDAPADEEKAHDFYLTIDGLFMQ